MVSYVQAMWRCRYFWISLVQMELRTRYRGSLLGIGWSLFQPLTMTFIFCLVFRRAFNVDVAEYAPYLLVGLATWHFIVKTTLDGCMCFRTSEAYIRQYPAPLGIYPLRAVLSGGIHFLVALAVVSVIAIALRGSVNLLALVSLIPSIFLLMCLGWATALLAGMAFVRFPDTCHLLEVCFQILFYLSPVMYYPLLLKHGKLEFLADYNPVTYFLHLFREPLVYGRFPAPGAFGAALLTVLIVGAIAAFTLSRQEKRFIFHL